jgi:hypothetical protein
MPYGGSPRGGAISYMAAAMGTSIGRVVDAVGTSSMCWILATTASTLHTSLALGSGTMDAANAMGTSSKRPTDVMENDVDAVRTFGRRVRSGMICIFNNYRFRIKKYHASLVKYRFLDHIVPNLEFTLYFMSFMII